MVLENGLQKEKKFLAWLEHAVMSDCEMDYKLREKQIWV